MPAILSKKNPVAMVVVSFDSIVASNLEEFQEEVSVKLNGHHYLVLDLRNVQFIDSAGCGAILNYVKDLRARKGDLVLCMVTSPVRALFDLIRMTRVVDVCASQQEAIAKIAA